MAAALAAGTAASAGNHILRHGGPDPDGSPDRGFAFWTRAGKGLRAQMQIDKNSTVAVIVRRTWANLHSVRMFLLDTPAAEIRGVDDSHILFAKVLDAEDARGVWIEVPHAAPTDGSDAERFRMMIPWSEVLALVNGSEFSAAIRHEARRIGFTGEMQSD